MGAGDNRVGGVIVIDGSGKTSDVSESTETAGYMCECVSCDIWETGECFGACDFVPRYDGEICTNCERRGKCDVFANPELYI